MVLLTILAVGLLSLSAVALRTSDRSSAETQARANARLALMLAIGELQKHAGADTRVTAPSGIVDQSGPPLTGVWKSWEGGDHLSSGQPIAPDYYSKTKRGENGGRFLSWLVSGALNGGEPTNPSTLAFPAPAANTVPILSAGTLGAGKEGSVHLVPQTASLTGKFAWWVSGENQKARLPVPYKPENEDSLAQWSDAVRSHAVADPQILGLDASAPGYRAMAEKSVTLPTVDFLPTPAAETSSPSFHDFSVSSTGLLTNTATGGWRKDMSIMTENWDALPATYLPFFRIYDTNTSLVTRPTPTDYQATQSIFYPWSGYWSGPTNPPIYQHGAATTWHTLKDYATSYKRINAAGVGYSTPFFAPTLTLQNQSFNYLHKIRIAPVIARVHWVFSHSTTLAQDDPDPSKRTYNLALLITPVITMWNPYNVTVTQPANLRIAMPKPMPCAFRHYNKDGMALPQYRRLTTGYDGLVPNESFTPGNHPVMVSGVSLLQHLINSAFTLAPGETRVFSPTETVGIRGANLNMSAGYRPGTGYTVNVSSSLGAGVLNASSQVKVDITFNTLFKEESAKPLFSGVWLDSHQGVSGGDYRQVNRMQYPPESANAYWPPIAASELASPTAGEINNTWRPFFSAVYGSRISGPSSTGLPGKGLLQASPLVSYMRVENNYGGNTGSHPAKSASDFSFFSHKGQDDKLPNAINANHRGFIVSGFSAAEGLSRMILSELPLRPLVSLGELQNWDMRGQNGVAPFQLNVIANSDASYMIAPEKVRRTNDPADLIHDDSYCANHLLFDDWFFSSVTPQPANLGSAIADDLRTHYTKFLKGERPLVNRAYRRIPEDIGLADGKITERVNDALSTDGWQRIASRLEVEGMFNVNSVSVKAWRALLGHAQDQKIPHHTEGGMALSGITDLAHSRFSIAGDKKAGDQGMSGSFPESSEITGYRVYDDAMLDILAEKIVGQVRLRGPFLSLSEFVNRQLSTDKNVALAGAIQTALNQMSVQAGNNDPLRILKSPALAQDAGDTNDPRLAGAGYLFPEAAVGKSTYGMPGWIRQADVLSPLAPILSARDDTFTIRAYGDARSPDGKTILAKAWCEATVRRSRDFVDPADPAESVNTPTRAANLAFGRRFSIVSFRWLSPDEV